MLPGWLNFGLVNPNPLQRQTVQENGKSHRPIEGKADLGKAAVQQYLSSTSGSLVQRLSGGGSVEGVNQRMLASNAIGNFDRIWNKNK